MVAHPIFRISHSMECECTGTRDARSKDSQNEIVDDYLMEMLIE